MTTLGLIAEYIFGRKYYLNIVYRRGTNYCEMSSDIYDTYEGAMQAKLRIQSTTSIGYVNTISFRTHQPLESYRGKTRE